MSNNGWIKYSEKKPEKSGNYLVYTYDREILSFVTQEDMNCFATMFNQYLSEPDENRYMAIEDEIHNRFKKTIVEVVGQSGAFHGEGFYSCWYDEDGFPHYEFVEPTHWQPIPEPPTE